MQSILGNQAVYALSSVPLLCHVNPSYPEGKWCAMTPACKAKPFSPSFCKASHVHTTYWPTLHPSCALLVVWPRPKLPGSMLTSKQHGWSHASPQAMSHTVLFTIIRRNNGGCSSYHPSRHNHNFCTSCHLCHEFTYFSNCCSLWRLCSSQSLPEVTLPAAL